LASVNGENFYGGGWYGSSGGWVEDVFDLTDVPTLGNLVGEPEVWIAFRFVSDGADSQPEGLYLDNILLQKDVSTPTDWVTIMSEDFEGDFPGSWTVGDNNGGDEYYWNKRNCRPYQGSNSGWAVGGGADGSGLACGSNFPNDADSWMVYGPFSLADATDAELRYWMWLDTDQSAEDKISILASVNGENFYGGGWYGSSGGWVEDVFDLTDVPTLGNLVGEPEVWIAFRFVSDGADSLPEGLYLDNILLQKKVSTPIDWTNIMTEDFESNFPYNWTVFDDNGPDYGEYQWGKRDCRPYQGSYSGWGVGGGTDGSALGCGSVFPTYADSWMMYGPFSLENAVDGELLFKLWLNTDVDGGDKIFYGASLDGTNYYGTSLRGNSAGWLDKNFDLTDVYNLGNLMGQSEVWIAFVFESDDYAGDDLEEGAYVDDIVLRVKKTGVVPPDFQIFLPLSLNNSTSNFEGPWEQEPNDNFARANGNLRSGKTYNGHHNDVADYFKVYLSQSGQITVDLDSQLTDKDNLGNYVVQLQLKDENGSRLDYKVGPDVQISRSVPPGVYYIYVHTRVDYADAAKEYSLRVTYPQ
ncbi:MAG: choice-of-anchor J domain-containing protein, partial [Chloroflexota bacterium]|nr:choice-of-anchor J domain-containing protein [Chloroflexota bacterium]